MVYFPNPLVCCIFRSLLPLPPVATPDPFGNRQAHRYLLYVHTRLEIVILPDRLALSVSPLQPSLQGRNMSVIYKGMKKVICKQATMSFEDL